MSKGPFKVWNGKTFKDLKREVLFEVYFYFDCSVSDAAHALGMSRMGLSEFLKKNGAEGFMDPLKKHNTNKTEAIMREFPDARRSYEEKKKMLLKLLDDDRGIVPCDSRNLPSQT